MSFGVTTYEDRTAGAYSKAVGLIQAENLSLSQDFVVRGQLDTLGVNSFRYDNLSLAVDSIDQKTVDTYLTPITSAKNTIISLGNLSVAESSMSYYGSEGAAITALESLYGAPADNDGVISTKQVITQVTISGAANTEGISVSPGMAITSDGGGGGLALFSVSSAIGEDAAIDIQDVSGTISGVIYGGGTKFGDAGSFQYAASGEVYADNVIVLLYPSLYPADTTSANPLGNAQFKILTGSNSGTGSGQTFYRNSIQGTYDSFPYTDDTFTLLDDVYTVSVNNSDIATQCSNIDALRGSSPTTGIQSFVGAGATMKGNRQSFAVNQWVLQKSGVDNQAIINANNSSISILKNSAFQP